MFSNDDRFGRDARADAIDGFDAIAAALDQGVELDAKTQLVTLAVNANQSVNPSAISKAVDAAGYVPVHLYTLRDDGQLATAALALK